MHKIKILATTILATLVAAMALTACSDDPHDPDFKLEGDVSKYFPSYCVSLNASYSISNKFISMTCEPRFYFEPKDWGLVVEKVVYYIDEELYETVTASPYEIKYESRNWTVGAHNVRADITISGKDIDTFVLSCSKVIDNSTGAQRAADIWFDYNNATQGDEFFIEANVNLNRSASGTRVTEFSASWDDVTMGRATSSPYRLSRKVTEAAGTSHKVMATLNYAQNGVASNYSFSMANYTVAGPETSSYRYILKSRYRDYKRGETLEGRARMFMGSETEGFYGLELFLDDDPIAESTEFPYDHSTPLTKWEPGEHNLKVQWVKYNGEGQRQHAFATYETITITE